MNIAQQLCDFFALQERFEFIRTGLPGPLGGRDCSDSQLPVCRLPEIRLVWVVEIGLEVTEHRRHRIEPVVGTRHGLRVAQLRERLHIEPICDLSGSKPAMRLWEIRPLWKLGRK